MWSGRVGKHENDRAASVDMAAAIGPVQNPLHGGARSDQNLMINTLPTCMGDNMIAPGGAEISRKRRCSKKLVRCSKKGMSALPRVRVNETLTLLFDEDSAFDSHHYAFHVNDAEFDGIFSRIKQAGFPTTALLQALTMAAQTTGTAAKAFASRTRMDACFEPGDRAAVTRC